jgi:predicted DNA-binding transcriptional regulator AlpA
MQSNNPDGLPCKLDTDKDLLPSILMHAKNGCDYETICELVGIGSTTLYRWLAEGQEPDADPKKAELWEELSRSKAFPKLKAIKAVMNNIDRDDLAAAKYFLSTRSKQWTEGTKVSLGGQEDNPVHIQRWIPKIGDKEINDNTG